MIISSNPKFNVLKHKKEILKNVEEVIDSGHYILGNHVGKFEQEFAHYIGATFGMGVASGTDALYLALRALNIGKDDEVIVSSHTATATITAIIQTGATPVFVDIEPDFFTMDAGLIPKALSKKTKAIMPVHLYGQPCDMDTIMKISEAEKIPVIEDASQAHGAYYQGKRVGSFGTFGCFSLYPTKNLGGLGDGGILVTDQIHLPDKIKSLRQYGWQNRFISMEHGWNSRLDEMQAAILRVLLKDLDFNNNTRQKIAEHYNKKLTSVKIPQVRKNAEHVFHLYVIQTENRDQLKEHLSHRDILGSIHYPQAVHQQPAYESVCRKATSLEVTEYCIEHILSLPMYPGLTEQEISLVIESVNEFS